MFKNLKDKIATQVSKTNQTILSSILQTDPASISKDSGVRTSSTTSNDDNFDHNRSRLNSAASDISQTASANNNYVSPARNFVLPSDIESEHGGDESDHETNSKMQKLVNIYKTKFIQLKNAYDEVERERDNIKNILQQQQDTSIKRQTKLREQIKIDRQAKEQLERSYKQEISLRDNTIQELTQQVRTTNDHTQVDQEEMRNLREKNTKLETLLTQCKEAIKNHQEKHLKVVTERDDLFEKLNEKQAFIESMMKDRQPEDSSIQVKENFDCDISMLLKDKERLQEESEAARLCVRQLETDLESTKQQSVTFDSNDDIKQKHEDLLTKFNEKSSHLEQIINDKLTLEISNKELQDLIKNCQETIDKDKQQIDILKDTLSKENEQHTKSLDALKTEYENLTNELQQTKQARDSIQVLLSETVQVRTIDKDLQIQQNQNTDDDINETKASFTQKLDSQLQEHLDEMATLKSQQQIKFDNNLKELQEEKDYLEIKIEQLENQHKKTIETLENELTAAAKRAQDKITDLTKQIDEQKNKSNHHEQELNEKSSQLIELEKQLETFKSQSNLSQKELVDECNSLKEQYQLILESNTQKNEQLIELEEKLRIATQQLQDEILHKKNIEKQLEEKQLEIISLNNSMDEFKTKITEHEQLQQTIDNSQSNDRQLLEQKDKMIDTLKQDCELQIEKLHEEHERTVVALHEKILNLNSEINEKDETFSAMEAKLNSTLSEKTNLKNELDQIRIQMETMQSNSNEFSVKFQQTEQQIKDLETDCDSYRNEIETLKTEIISLVNINEENIRRIDQYESEKFDFEQDISEKDRQITERDEKIQEIELTLKQTQERATKLREALQRTKGSIKNNEQANAVDSENQIQVISQEYEQRLKEKEKEYNTKLKAMAKEMSSKIEENEYNYNQQIHDLIQNKAKVENDLTNSAERRINDAERRAYISEEQISKLQEQIKEKQLDYHRNIQDLQIEIHKLTKQIIPTIEQFSQTSIEDLYSNTIQHSFVIEPTEVDYLKQIVLAYMTGTDRLTMAKVICAVLRYNESEKSLIIDEEKLRQSRWLNSTR
ncbi:unnamed protein product [Rotaria magnacalcarata]